MTSKSVLGAGEYGMTKLFLDTTVNTKQNFWGNSILANHRDVKKKSMKNEGDFTEASYHDVMGYTIIKLMEMTLIAWDEGRSCNRRRKEGITSLHYIMMLWDIPLPPRSLWK